MKKKLEKPEVFHKIRRKVKPTKLKPKKEVEERSASPLSDESFCSEVGGKIIFHAKNLLTILFLVPEAKKRLEENEVTDFFASPYWKRFAFSGEIDVYFITPVSEKRFAVVWFFAVYLVRL